VYIFSSHPPNTNNELGHTYAYTTYPQQSQTMTLLFILEDTLH